jgi:hypothetical protein
MDDNSMLRFQLLFCVLLFASCANKQERGLHVRQYHLRESMLNENIHPVARGEVLRVLHGAVTEVDRRKKIGQYYNVTWSSLEELPPNEIVFEYLQAATGSKVQRQIRKNNNPQKSFVEYFAINDELYRKKGRVMAWRISARRNNKEISNLQSYMWR